MNLLRFVLIAGMMTWLSSKYVNGWYFDPEENLITVVLASALSDGSDMSCCIAGRIYKTISAQGFRVRTLPYRENDFIPGGSGILEEDAIREMNAWCEIMPD